MPDLPGAVHLVADAPVLDAVRLTVAVGGPQVGVLRPKGGVAIFDQVGGLLDGARPHVDGQHWLRVDQPGEFHELIGAELVGLDRLPGQVAAARALILRPDAVQPAVAAEEVAAGVAHGAEVQFAQGGQHILAQPALVGVR